MNNEMVEIEVEGLDGEPQVVRVGWDAAGPVSKRIGLDIKVPFGAKPKPEAHGFYADLTPEQAIKIADALYARAKGTPSQENTQTDERITELEAQVANLRATLQAEIRFGEVQSTLANSLRDIITNVIRREAA